MHIAVELPEEIAQRLQAQWKDLARGALEAIAAEGFRDGTLTRDQVGRLLDLSFWETEAFLKRRQAYLHYTEADLEEDRQDLDRRDGALLPHGVRAWEWTGFDRGSSAPSWRTE
jgi:predicted HTH domain antitoxin